MNLAKKNILIVGDAMLDEYYYGDVLRVSPEAPTVIFKKNNQNYSLGGAANVAKYLVAANQNVVLMTAVGNDSAGDILLQQLKSLNINTKFIQRMGSKTTVKTRIVSRNQQIFRIDSEDFLSYSDLILQNMVSCFESLFENMDVIIMSDYNKGFLSDEFSRSIIDSCKKKGKRLCVDVKGNNPDKYCGAFLLKPNLLELSALTGLPLNTNSEVIFAARELLKYGKNEYVLVTCGERGMILVANDLCQSFNATAHEIFDVTGAGDCVISYLAACLANDYDIISAVKISNIAAGLQVSRLGTTPVLPNEINIGFTSCSSKIVALPELKDILSLCKSKKIVFTNGCFDIIHSGHIAYLEEASRLGDILIVGLNSDMSVKRLKGEQRPFNSQEDRAFVLSSLNFITYVVIFDEDTPLNLIKCIKPDILVKGSDYSIDDIVGKDYVHSYGGKVVTIPYVKNKSTTEIIDRIKKM